MESNKMERKGKERGKKRTLVYMEENVIKRREVKGEEEERRELRGKAPMKQQEEERKKENG